MPTTNTTLADEAVKPKLPRTKVNISLPIELKRRMQVAADREGVSLHAFAKQAIVNLVQAQSPQP